MQRFIASGFGVGLIPKKLWGSDNGAGTFGAALAAIVAWFVWPLGIVAQFAVLVIAIGLSLWSPRPFSAGHADPGWIVIDEIAGTLIALVGLTAGGIPWFVALVVARLADIFKVLPGVRRAEALPGAIGITMDDLLAGLYGLAVGWALVAIL
ncbi:MAG: phosphatidylglycerophosphatase A [Actinobacteria bacterium]|nr:phosphatidylglycerophosphatase A [Actinomycetota bacterium]